jgi:DNA-binding XRE family transcriptional regulator
MARQTRTRQSDRAATQADSAATQETPLTETGLGLEEAPQAFSRARSEVEEAAGIQARNFGALVRERREALRMRQDDLALATGVGRRFILELEAGKASCQLGRALVVAAAVGLRPFDVINASPGDDDDAPFLPDDDDDLPEDDGHG